MTRSGEISYPPEYTTVRVGGTLTGSSSLHDPLHSAFVAGAGALLLTTPTRADVERKLRDLIERACQDAATNRQFEPFHSILCTAGDLVERHGLDLGRYEELFVNLRSYAGSVFQDAMREIAFSIITDPVLEDALLLNGTLVRAEGGQVRLARYHASPDDGRYAMSFEDAGTAPTIDDAIAARRSERLVETIVRVDAPARWSLERTVYPLFYHTFPRLPGLTSSPDSA